MTIALESWQTNASAPRAGSPSLEPPTRRFSIGELPDTRTGF